MLLAPRVMVTIPPRRSLHALHTRGHVGVTDDLTTVLAKSTHQHEFDLAKGLAVPILGQQVVRVVEQIDGAQVNEPETRGDEAPIRRWPEM